MDLEIKTDTVDLDQSMYYMQMSLQPQQTPFDMNRYQYQQNYPGASKLASKQLKNAVNSA